MTENNKERVSELTDKSYKNITYSLVGRLGTTDVEDEVKVLDTALDLMFKRYNFLNNGREIFGFNVAKSSQSENYFSLNIRPTNHDITFIYDKKSNNMMSINNGESVGFYIKNKGAEYAYKVYLSSEKSLAK